MESILREIINLLSTSSQVDQKLISQIIYKHNKNVFDNSKHIAKKHLMPFYLQHKDLFNLSKEEEQRLAAAIKVKPTRTASGVATITVITKPWTCSSACLYCPNDVRMPKSYLHDEPACQRAERNFFDPYLQVSARLKTLTEMGHTTDKIELIVLGGTWTDYPFEYQTWFMHELFKALNDFGGNEDLIAERRAFYEECGLTYNRDILQEKCASAQSSVDAHEMTFNEAINSLYFENDAWKTAAKFQTASMDDLFAQHKQNEDAKHRVVGLVVETRPDCITAKTLRNLRLFGCTKIQVGIQSVRNDILKMNNRNLNAKRIEQAFSLLRIFGFKIHSHFMVNLLGMTPQEDKQDFHNFVNDKRFLPDEIKLYPCSLISGTELCKYYESGQWRPYTEEELLDVLSCDVVETKPYTRISRMIRDFSAGDIVVGNKKGNLRQLVENNIANAGGKVDEIRYREISLSKLDINDISLNVYEYETCASKEFFLQWLNAEGKIIGFLRLSFPDKEFLSSLGSESPVSFDEAMIREVHVYGKVAGIGSGDSGTQHLGLGKQLVEKACQLARDAGYKKLNVISSVGTRNYYRSLGFEDTELYLCKHL